MSTTSDAAKAFLKNQREQLESDILVMERKAAELHSDLAHKRTLMHSIDCLLACDKEQPN